MAISYNPSAFLKGAKTTFAMGYNPDLTWLDKLCYKVTSVADSEVHPWVGQPPQMVELIDGESVLFTGLSDASVTLTNKTYAAGLEFLRKHIDDQQNGVLDLRVRQAADVASGIYNKHLTDLIVDGTNTTTTAYDGAAFFSGTHPARIDSGAQDNLLAGTGTTTAQITTDLAAAIAWIQTCLAENGEPFAGGVNLKFTAMCPAAIAHNFREVLTASVISQTTNIYMGAAELIVNPRLDATDTGDWYLFAETPSMKPFIYQERDGIEFSSQDGTQESDATFTRELYRYKVRARHAFGYGYWQLATKTVNS